MPTSAREYSETDIYHVFARANNREKIFLDKSDKDYYINLIKLSKDELNISVFAFAIMDNHIYILLKAKREDLSKIMKFIQQSYTFYFNKKYKHSGRVFGSRFKSKGCNDDIYLTELVKYIHLNPKKAGLSDLYMNMFTSHRFYVSDCDSFVDVNYILNFFSADISKARIMYLDYLNLPFNCSAKDIYCDGVKH